MSTYRKEKNLVIISLDNATGNYTFDIATGLFYGIKGNPVKTCPRRSEIRSLFPCYRGDNGNNLGYVLRQMFDNNGSTATYADYCEVLQAADKVDAIGMPLLCLRKEQYRYLGENMKLLSAWRKANPNEEFTFRFFKEWGEYEKAKKNLGSVADLLTAEMYSHIKDRNPNVTIEELGIYAYYLGRGKFWEYHRGDISRLSQYLEMCKAMEKTPQKVNNFMREWWETKEEYELRRTEFDNRKIANNFAKHSKAWEFEYGDYTIVLPTCAKDIIDEGSNMHHCVGSYVSNVIENQTYIVFVRRKDTPDKCYITCQVHTNGNIGQYFLAYDRYIHEQVDIDFKEAFAKHLRDVWELG